MRFKCINPYSIMIIGPAHPSTQELLLISWKTHWRCTKRTGRQRLRPVSVPPQMADVADTCVALMQRTNSSRDRWTPKMLPLVPETLWRKTSQWVELTRPHAMRIVEDTVIDPVIKKHCTIGYDRKLKR